MYTYRRHAKIRFSYCCLCLPSSIKGRGRYVNLKDIIDFSREQIKNNEYVVIRTADRTFMLEFSKFKTFEIANNFYDELSQQMIDFQSQKTVTEMKKLESLAFKIGIVVGCMILVCFSF
jgi:hypothetical protein